MRVYILFLLTSFILSCNRENHIPKHIIEAERMRELLWDMARADAYVTGFAGKNDSSFNRIKETVNIYRQIFQIHKTNREEFKKSLEWYQGHPVIMRPLLDSLENRRRKIMQERSKPPTMLRIDSLRNFKKDLKP